MAIGSNMTGETNYKNDHTNNLNQNNMATNEEIIALKQKLNNLKKNVIFFKEKWIRA